MKLSKIVNWFKSNIIRCFHLDEWKNNIDSKNFNSPNFSFPTHIQRNHNTDIKCNDKRYSVDSDNIRNYRGFIEFNKQSSRYKRQTDQKQIGKNQFFIEKINSHYTKLNEVIYLPLSNIIIHDNKIGLKKRLESNISTDIKIPSYSMIKHIEKDDIDMYNHTISLIQKLEQHNFMVKQNFLAINNIIKNKCNENGIVPVYDRNFELFGFYYEEDALTVLELIWIGFIDGENIDTSFKRYNDFNVSKELRINIAGYVIGRGKNIDEVNKIKNIFESIVKDKFILDSFMNLMNNRQQLLTTINNIKSSAEKFSRLIQQDMYRTLCECCPTKNSNVWNFD